MKYYLVFYENLFFHEVIVAKSFLLQLFPNQQLLFQNILVYFKYNSKILSVNSSRDNEIDVYLVSILNNQNTHIKIYVHLNTDSFIFKSDKNNLELLY